MMLINSYDYLLCTVDTQLFHQKMSKCPAGFSLQRRSVAMN